MEPLCIYTKQIAYIEKVGERQAQRILKDIKTDLNKKKRHVVTVKEFSEFKGYDEAEVREILRKLP